MKVLHVNDYRSAGGCEVLIDETIHLLRARGVQAELFTSDAVPGHRRSARRYISNRACCVALAKRIESFQPDVVHLHNFYHELSPAILSTLARLRSRSADRFRVVMTAHDYHLICPNSGLCEISNGRFRAADADRANRWSYLLTRRWDHRGLRYSMLKLAQHVWNYRVRGRRRMIDLVICPSEFMFKSLSRIGLRTVLLPHPVPKVAHPPARLNDRLHWVFAGRLEPEKGLAEFLSILPADFPGRLTILGDGSELDHCREICRHRGFAEPHRVRFAGWEASEQARRTIGEAHVLVLPSLCPENSPMSLLEALAMRTNVLASDLGGMREIVLRSGVGHLFAPGDAECLVRAIDTICDQFASGDLNSFDVSSFLQQRNERAYLEGVLRAYQNEAEAHVLEPAAGAIG